MITPRDVLFAAIVLALGAAGAQAQTLVYEQDGDALFSIEFPEGWQVDLDFEDEARDAGTYREGEELEIRIVEARPNDGGEAWVGLWVIPGASNLDEAADYLSSLNRDLFAALEISRPAETEINGMAARTATATGTHEGQQVEFIAALFEPREGTVAAGLYVGAEDTWETYRAELEAMVASLEPAD